MTETKVPRIVVGVLIYNNNNQFFLAKSHKWKNKWIVPGGHLEWGESLEQGVKREVLEETGLKVFDLQLINVQESIFSEEFHDKRHFIFLDYICKAENNEVKLNEELQEFIWISPEDSLKKLELNTSTRKFIEISIENDSK